jgi:beta-aspartyl-peptidase (threonine type)
MFFLVGCKENVDIKIEKDGEAGYAIVLHGGAGTILKENMSEEAEAAYRTALNNALEIGENILKSGGSSLDAVEQTIMFMEDSPLFNAGKGAVFAHSGKNEMDASIMFGKDQNAGAVGGVTNIKHPISAARAVMEKSEHVLLVGIGAESFAAQSGIDTVNPAYFYTERRWEGLQKILNEEENNSGENVDGKHGTVGVVALDLSGNIAAGTSTGGMTNKRFNRIGDSPIIGAGTYANNATCGVSSTGHGEFFIRYAVAYDIHAQMQYGGKSLEEAANHTILDVLPDKGGTGGIIAIDAKGNIVMPFNTTGMYRAYANDHERFIGIYKDDGKRKVPNK